MKNHFVKDKEAKVAYLAKVIDCIAIAGGNALQVCLYSCIVYAMETYIIHFLEPTQFLNAPDLVVRKVNLLYTPQ